MTLHGLPIVVCLLMAFAICMAVPAWPADREAGVRAADGGSVGVDAGGATAIKRGQGLPLEVCP